MSWRGAAINYRGLRNGVRRQLPIGRIHVTPPQLWYGLVMANDFAFDYFYNICFYSISQVNV